MELSRRRFLGLLGTGAVTTGLSGCFGPDRPPKVVGRPGTSPSTTSGGATSSSPASPTSRLLVVLNLAGGNDGLNTVVPLDGRYHDARPTIGLPDDQLVNVPGTDAFGLHPALAPLQPLLGAGQVALVQSVGYPHPSRSHFQASDDWWSGTPGQPAPTGWLGRFLDALGPDVTHPLRAVSLGANSPALAATTATSTTVLSPAAFSFGNLPGGTTNPLVRAWSTPPAPASTGLEADLRRAAVDAAASVAVFQRLNEQADHEPASDEPTNGTIAAALATAARLVAADVGTRVVYVTVGGFDTHAGQLATQQRLLADAAAGIVSFFQHLTTTGHADRTVLMTVSEFGRRVHENGSGGTDHGKASVQLLVGPSVRGGVVGTADLGRLDDGDLSATVDVRSYYATCLHWLGADTDRVLGSGWEDLGLLRP